MSPPLPTVLVAIAALGFGPMILWALVYEQWLILGGLIMVALLPAIVRWPVVSTFGLYALVAASLDALPLLPGGTSLSKPIGVLAGGALFAAGLVERRLGSPPRAALWWGSLILWGMLSAAWAIDPEVLFERLPTVLSLFLLYLVAVCFRPSRRELYAVCALTVLGGMLAATLAYTLGLDQMASGSAARGRIVLGEMDTNPNTLGRVLTLPLGLAIAGFLASRGAAQRAVTLGCAGLIALGVFISMSRGALVAVAAMLSILLYRLRARKQIVAIMLLLLALSATMPAAFYERVDAMISGEDNTGSGRTEIWKTGVGALGEYGVVGAGLNNVRAAYKAYGSIIGHTAHNVYLLVWLELGIVGLTLLLAAIATSLLAVRRARSAGHGSVALSALEAVCIGTLIGGMFGDSLWTKSFWQVWILLTWATYSETRSDNTSDAFMPRR
jgi:O-antigen ligase